METLISRKETFLYRIINDKLEVSKVTFELVMSGLYAEELLGEDTQALIASTPVIKPVGGLSTLGKVACLALVGVVAAGAYMLVKKRQS